VTDFTTPSRVQLLLYGFGSGGDFEGRLVGALERTESGGALRVLDTLFVMRDAESGELSAISLASDGAGGVVAPLLGFRLDPAQRRKATEQALSRPIGDTVEALGRLLEPGAALAAVLVEHVWAGVLEDAVARTGGTALASTFVESTTVADLGPQLLAAARSRRTSAAGR
jgi:hypothetical protein